MKPSKYQLNQEKAKHIANVKSKNNSNRTSGQAILKQHKDFKLPERFHERVLEIEK
jgi:hypothetical protein